MRTQLCLLITWLSGALAFSGTSDLVVRNLPGYSSLDTIHEIRRRLHNVAARAETHVVFDVSEPLNHQISDKTLFEYTSSRSINSGTKGQVEAAAGIKITCTRCYMRGQARAKLTANGAFNKTEITKVVESNLKGTMNGIKAFTRNITDVVSGNVRNLTVGEIKDELEQVPPPQFDFNFNIDFPSYDLDVEFVDTEIYVELKTVLSSGLTYTLNLFSSRNLGVQLDPLFVGVIFAVDLILSVDSEIDISSGFHIKLDDKLRMKLVLFGKEASDVKFNDGKFAFLPITIESENVVLRAILRLQLRTGFSLPPIDLPATVQGKKLELGAGIEARAYVKVAEFVTNITAQHSAQNEKKDCALRVVQDYKLAVGAAAGASVEVLGTVFGPTPATEVPIFYTTLAAACLTKGRATTTKAPKMEARRIGSGSSTTTTETTIVYNATACLSPTLINCPASLQTISRNSVTKTLTATVSSGSEAVWSTPAVTEFQAAAFQGDVFSFKGSSGAPKSYLPPPITTSTSSSGESSPGDKVLGGQTGGVSNKIIIGVSVGIGVPLLLAIVCGIIFIKARQRRTTIAVSENDEQQPDRAKRTVNAAYSAVPQDRN
ncbi:hypothetical protein QQS21_010117 [Conoideocrella luteorostrata]|uniref:Mid2 domain-containing protein n=1 Tax=Conoideocrella luteorostrata TaxID=1105319 RepID=A0AAJ0FV17_9HYPO|nr:hypothetical protein QQS21_010117 [Conoideocrella luteorostrata]